MNIRERLDEIAAVAYEEGETYESLALAEKEKRLRLSVVADVTVLVEAARKATQWARDVVVEDGKEVWYCQFCDCDWDSEHEDWCFFAKLRTALIPFKDTDV